MGNLTLPLVIIVVTFIGFIAVFQIIPMLASSGISTAQQSANLLSSNTKMSTILPGIALIIAIGVVGKILGGR